MSLVARFARALEDGAIPAWPLTRAAAAAWARVASRGVARPLALPGGVHVVAVGGATLGGSGKTPVALAYALSRPSALPVVIVGHAYRASPRIARVVEADDDVAVVGDEALACARAIDAHDARNVRVVVAPRRQAAIDFAAANGARVIVLDGVAQTSPTRASLAMLAVDAESPWGAGVAPPLGDLRASSASLIDACDEIVALRDRAAPPSSHLGCRARSVRVVDVESRGVWNEGALVSWEEVARRRVALVTSIARPSRVVAALTRRGVVPCEVRSFADHHAPNLSAPAGAVDLWLTTSKCAAYVTDASGRPLPAVGAALRGVPLAHIDHTPSLEPFRSLP